VGAVLGVSSSWAGVVAPSFTRRCPTFTRRHPTLAHLVAPAPTLPLTPASDAASGTRLASALPHFDGLAGRLPLPLLFALQGLESVLQHLKASRAALIVLYQRHVGVRERAGRHHLIAMRARCVCGRRGRHRCCARALTRCSVSRPTKGRAEPRAQALALGAAFAATMCRSMRSGRSRVTRSPWRCAQRSDSDSLCAHTPIHTSKDTTTGARSLRPSRASSRTLHAPFTRPSTRFSIHLFTRP